MGFLDKAKKQLTDAVDKHGDRIADGVDRAAQLADERTKGKHSDKIARGSTKAKEALEKLDKKDDGDVGRPRG